MDENKKQKDEEKNYERFAWKEGDLRIIKWPPKKKDNNE